MLCPAQFCTHLHALHRIRECVELSWTLSTCYVVQFVFDFSQIVLLGKIKLDPKGTISHNRTPSVAGTIDPLRSIETCINHNYNQQSISLPSRTIREGEERGNSTRFSFVDEVELEDSPLTLMFVSENQNVLHTGVTVQVAMGFNEL